jgi:hypothetical protein
VRVYKVLVLSLSWETIAYVYRVAHSANIRHCISWLCMHAHTSSFNPSHLFGPELIWLFTRWPDDLKNSFIDGFSCTSSTIDQLVNFETKKLSINLWSWHRRIQCKNETNPVTELINRSCMHESKLTIINEFIWPYRRFDHRVCLHACLPSTRYLYIDEY